MFARAEASEKKLKEAIVDLLNEELYKPYINPEIKASFDLYLSKKWYYIGSKGYFEDQLQILL